MSNGDTQRPRPLLKTIYNQKMNENRWHPRATLAFTKIVPCIMIVNITSNYNRLSLIHTKLNISSCKQRYKRQVIEIEISLVYIRKKLGR